MLAGYGYILYQAFHSCSIGQFAKVKKDVETIGLISWEARQVLGFFKYLFQVVSSTNGSFYKFFCHIRFSFVSVAIFLHLSVKLKSRILRHRRRIFDCCHINI